MQNIVVELPIKKAVLPVGLSTSCRGRQRHAGVKSRNTRAIVSQVVCCRVPGKNGSCRKVIVPQIWWVRCNSKDWEHSLNQQSHGVKQDIWLGPQYNHVGRTDGNIVRIFWSQLVARCDIDIPVQWSSARGGVNGYELCIKENLKHLWATRHKTLIFDLQIERNSRLRWIYLGKRGCDPPIQQNIQLKEKSIERQCRWQSRLFF